MNTVNIVGNLVRDVNLKRTNTGKSVANFIVAVNREFVGQNGEKQKQTDYVPVAVWGAQADMAAQELYKGARVFVEGRYTSRSYEANGEKKYITEVTANFIAKPLGQKSEPNDGYSRPQGGNFGQFGPVQEDIPF